jgi:hypothetical protein
MAQLNYIDEKMNTIINNIVNTKKSLQLIIKQKKQIWNKNLNKLVWQFVIPKIELPVILSGEDTNKIKVCPVNKDAYNSELEKKHRNELQYGNNNNDELSMEERFKQGLPLNETPIMYCVLTGQSIEGNTRLEVAHIVWEKYNVPLEKRIIKVLPSSYAITEDLPRVELRRILSKVNKMGKRDEDSPAAIYNFFIPLIKDFYLQYEDLPDFTSKSKRWRDILQPFIKDYGNDLLDIKRIYNLYKVSTIEDDKAKAEIVDNLVDLSFTEIDKMLSDHNKFKTKKDHNVLNSIFVDEIKKSKKLLIEIKKAIYNEIKIVRDRQLHYKDGRVVSVLDEDLGQASFNIAGIISNWSVFNLGKVWNDYAFDTKNKLFQCVTEAYKMNTKKSKNEKIPDLRFNNLTDLALKENPNVEAAEQEIKCSLNDSLWDIIYYGGTGLKFMNPTPFFFVNVTKDLEKSIIVFGMADKNDVTTGKGGCTIKFKNWYNNHCHSNDFVFISGNIKTVNGYYKPEWEEVK